MTLKNQLLGREPIDDEDLLRWLLSMEPRRARHAISQLGPDRFKAVTGMLLSAQREQRKENQLAFYSPVGWPEKGKSMAIHQTDAKVIGIGGGNRACLPLFAMVLMKGGGWKQLGDVEPGDEVHTLDPEKGNSAETARVTRVYRSGVREVYCISLAGNHSFLATMNHMIPCRFNKEKRVLKRALYEIMREVRSGGKGLAVRMSNFQGKREFTEVIGFSHLEDYSCGDLQVDHPAHCYVTNNWVVVSNSKTDTCLAEIIMCATGIFPKCIRENTDIASKFKGRPISVRIVIQSLTTTLHPTILPKLQWWQWNGVGAYGGSQGHWGWIPRSHLIAGSWTRSWSEKLRTLRIACRDPETGKYLGESKIQFMSNDQDSDNFKSGEFDIILHDEIPNRAIWVEDQARAMSVGGRMMLAMTWPDDPEIAVDWIFDEIFDPAERGEEGYFWTELHSFDNPNIDREALKWTGKNWSEKRRQTRFFGRPMRFSNRIHPYFTDTEHWWCFTCKDTCYVEKAKCAECESTNITNFCHVSDFYVHPHWPTVWLLDPHPRKPHMYQWWQIDPNDDLWLVADGECDGGVESTKEEVDRVEREHSLHVMRRLIDPNMGRSPASARVREITWQDEFDSVGLTTDLADDSSTGRERVNEYLRVDYRTLRPRINVHRRCAGTIHQMQRYVWDDYKEKQEREQKQVAKAKNDDYPTLMKYFLNSDPQFTSTMSTQIYRRRENLPQHRGRIWASP